MTKAKIDSALIVAPKGVIGTWYNQEIPVHLPDHIENVTIMWQANITKGQSKKIRYVYLKPRRRTTYFGYECGSFFNSKRCRFCSKIFIVPQVPYGC